MTNVTFTKGIGTPVYMSPEVLKREHYKKPADIYSFALTIFETMKWGFAYEGKEFKFEWKIADFVMNGKRLDKPPKMKQEIYELICSSWQQEPKERERDTIDQVIEKLSSLGDN